MSPATKPFVVGAVVAMACAGGGCGALSGPRTADEKELLRIQVQNAIADFRTVDPTLEGMMQKAHAYVVFPKIVTAAVVFGGAHGEGEVYQKGKLVGYADLSQGSFGAQIGGQKYAELIVFESAGRFEEFKRDDFTFGAQATAVAASSGAGASADPVRGVLVFTLPESGFMAQAAIGGQKVRFKAAGN